MGTEVTDALLAERNITIITAFCTSQEHPAGSAEEDVAGALLFEILDDVADALVQASTAAEEKAARADFYSLIVRLLAIIDRLLEYSAIDADKYQIISTLTGLFGEDHVDSGRS